MSRQKKDWTIKTVLDEYEKMYSYLYDSYGQPYEEQAERVERILCNVFQSRYDNDDMFKFATAAISAYRGDCFTSDREQAAWFYAYAKIVMHIELDDMLEQVYED